MMECALLLVKDGEGFSSTLYKDVNEHLMIGYGYDINLHGISEDVADILAIRLLTTLEQQLNGVLVNKGILLSEHRRAVLLDMAYNMGMDGLLSFKRMFAALRDRNYIQAAKEVMDSNYAKTVGVRAIRNAYNLEHDTCLFKSEVGDR